MKNDAGKNRSEEMGKIAFQNVETLNCVGAMFELNKLNTSWL